MISKDLVLCNGSIGRFEKQKINTSFVKIFLGKIDLKIGWNLNEKSVAKLLNSFTRIKNKYYKGKYKIPKIGYQGCSLNIPPNNIYVYRNIIIKKNKGVYEMYSDDNRKFEKEILDTAPKDVVPDVIYEIEFQKVVHLI